MKSKAIFLRRLLIAIALLALFTITGFFILPPIAKAQLEKRLTAELGRQVTVERVRLNPYTLALTLENFAIRERDGRSLFLGWRRLYVNFDALSSLRGEWVVGDIELDGFDGRARLNPDQSFNFSDLLARFTPPAGAPPPPPSKPARPVRVVRLQVADARADITDLSRSQPFHTVLGPLTFVVSEFRTVSERGAPYRFDAVTEAGEKLAWSGTLQAEPFHSTGELRLENIVLAKYAPFYADRIQADITAGKLSVRGNYEINLADKQRTLKLAAGALQLRDIKLVDRRNQEAVLELPSLDVSGVEADAVALKATVGSVVVDGGQLHARREKDGSINLLTMLQPPVTPGPAPAANGPAATPAKLPDVTVLEFVVKNFDVGGSDLTAPRAAQLTLSRIELSLKNITLAEGAQMPLHLAFTWAPQGTVQLDGTVGIQPVSASLQATVNAFAILPLSPYVEQFANVRLTQGTVSAKLETQFAMPSGKPAVASASGDVTIDKLGVVDGVRNEELAGFGQLALRGLRARTAPELRVSLDEINVAAPYARVVVNTDTSLNLAAVTAKTIPPEGVQPTAIPATSTPEGASVVPAAAPATAPSAPTSAAPKIEIARLVIADGDYRFTDRSIEPNVSMAIDHFGGTISGLSSANVTKADLDLKATVDGAGPVAITGRLDPLGAKKSVDLKIDFKNVELLPLSPYSGKFAGYELARGKLALDVKVLLDGSKIDATNVITLNQFTFGNPVKSPDATSLPVRLGVALLKDMDGKIVIDVPVQGRTDDPNFRIGRVVLRVIVNLLTKAAVSPFSLLGAAFGGGGDELAFQEFSPGSAEIQPAEMKKLETMTQALTNRPGLGLDLEGGYDVAADTYALKRIKLTDQIRRAIWEAKRQADPTIAPPEKLEIAAEEHVAMVKKLYDEKFPPGTQFGAPVPAAPAVVTPPPPPQSFFQRVVRTVTFRAKREQRAAVQENERLAAEHQKAVAAAIAAGLPLDEMTGRLAETVLVDDNDLRALATARAQQVRTYFTGVGKIAPERLFLAREQAEPAADAASKGKGPRVFLHLQ